MSNINEIGPTLFMPYDIIKITTSPGHVAKDGDSFFDYRIPIKSHFGGTDRYGYPYPKNFDSVYGVYMPKGLNDSANYSILYTGVCTCLGWYFNTNVISHAIHNGHLYNYNWVTSYYAHPNGNLYMVYGWRNGPTTIYTYTGYSLEKLGGIHFIKNVKITDKSKWPRYNVNVAKVVDPSHYNTNRFLHYGSFCASLHMSPIWWDCYYRAETLWFGREYTYPGRHAGILVFDVPSDGILDYVTMCGNCYNTLITDSGLSRQYYNHATNKYTDISGRMTDVLGIDFL